MGIGFILLGSQQGLYFLTPLSGFSLQFGCGFGVVSICRLVRRACLYVFLCVSVFNYFLCVLFV